MQIRNPLKFIQSRKIYFENGFNFNKNDIMHFIHDQVYNGRSTFFLPYMHNQENQFRVSDDYYNDTIEWLKSRNFEVNILNHEYRKCSKKKDFKYCQDYHLKQTTKWIDDQLFYQFNCDDCVKYISQTVLLTVKEDSQLI